MFKSFALAALPALCLSVSAQTPAPANAPATAPTTAPTKIAFPASFVHIEVGEHVAVAEAGDEKWVRETLATMKPATRPTTMPADILARVIATRADISKQMQADLLLDAKDAEEFYDKFLIPAENHEAELKTNIIVLVTSKTRLAELMRNGLEIPNFSYNRLTNDISYKPTLDLSANEQAIYSLYAEDSAENVRRDALAVRVREIDTQRMAAQGSESAVMVQRLFVGFIGTKVIIPLKLKPNQEWFGLGALGFLASKYSAEVIGIDHAAMVRQLSAPIAKTPIRGATLDLVHPPNPADMRREYLPAYVDALRRRSLTAVAGWVKRDGDQVIPKVLTELKKNPPADGPALVKMIKDVTGADLTQDLSPQP